MVNAKATGRPFVDKGQPSPKGYKGKTKGKRANKPKGDVLELFANCFKDVLELC